MIHLKTTKRSVEFENDVDVLLSENAEKSKVFLNMRCGGNGSCGGCMVLLKEGRFKVGNNEVHLVEGDKPKKALSCRTKIISQDAVIHVPELSQIEISGKISDDFLLKNYKADTQTRKFYLTIPEATMECQDSDRIRVEKELKKVSKLKNIYMPLKSLQKLGRALQDGDQKITVTIGKIRNYWYIIDIQPGDTSHTNIAVAVDIGTTTVVGILINLEDGKVLSRASRYNQQLTVADDVASRISYCENQAKVEKQHKLIVHDTINPIIHDLCTNTGHQKTDINRMAISGNTVMIHLLLCLDPTSMGKIPFQPVTHIPGEYVSTDIGIDINPQGIIDMIPSFAAYLGGDITSDIYVSKIHHEKELTVMADIGTNGEIVVCNEGKLVACATPAGPAFEGAGLYHGCRAAIGAIENIRIDLGMEITYTVIGDAPPTGLCGSAIIDFIGCGFHCGLLNSSGRFDLNQLKEKNRYYSIEDNGNLIHGCIIAKEGESGLDMPIIITEKDVNEILLAKSAIYSGIKTLLEIEGKSTLDIKKFILAGGFARHINIENSIRMGLIPEVPIQNIEVIGNGSLAGAFLALVEPNALEKMLEISKKPVVKELNLVETFQQNYIDALFLPNMKEEEFPMTMKERLCLTTV